MAGPPVYRYNLAVSDMLSDAGRYGYPGRPDTSHFEKREETMLRTAVIVGFGLVLACAAQGMPLAPLHQPDNTITQARMGCGVGQVMVNGVCQSRAGMRQQRRCARWTGSTCAQWQ